jgi:hypothetical protein
VAAVIFFSLAGVAFMLVFLSAMVREGRRTPRPRVYLLLQSTPVIARRGRGVVIDFGSLRQRSASAGRRM